MNIFEHNRKPIISTIKRLIEQNLVGVLFQKSSENPHIIRTGFEPNDDQINQLENDDIHHTCLYPRSKHLKKVINREKYINKPYTLLMALGEPQLSFISFDLSVLEFYRNDPRYYYNSDDINGSICIKDEFYFQTEIPEKDKVLLSTFGFSYDDNFNRSVAVFLRYLSDLSPEHQKIWQAKETRVEKHKIHPDYYNSVVMGSWDTKISIFSAFITELHLINQMCEAMNRPQLFKKDFGEYGDNKPKKFGFLIRPTLNEFQSFTLLLDQLMSDNINKKFFQKEIPYEIETPRKDGKIVIQQKGTIVLLDDWMRSFFNFQDDKLWKDTINVFKKIRKLRQEPAHSINEDYFDQKYFQEQRKLIIESYDAISIIRIIFERHPKVVKKNIEIPTWIKNNQICTY